MACMERKNETCSPFIPRRNALRKTCAEIVSEARQYLQVQSTKRPFTPRNGQRLLFGQSSVRADRESRPPSAVSVHAQHFDGPDSRPGSATRLPPLDHKPKFPVLFYAEDPVKVFPKPPTYPLEGKKQLTGTRARLVRAGSLTILPSLDSHKDVKERLTPDPEQKQPSAGHVSSTDRTEVRCGLRKLGPHRTASESRIKRPHDLGPTESREGRRTEPWNGDKTAGAQGAAESLLWKNRLAALLQQLETAAAGSPEGSVDRLCDLCSRLHSILSEADMLGQRCKERSGILRTLFRLIDLNSARLNLHIAKLCLALCVSGNNLLNICKLIFKISRHEINDILFQNNSVIGALLAVLRNEDVSAAGEALLYCAGTLKFLSGNTAILQLMLDNNCVGVAQQLIQKLSAVEGAHAPMAGHILVQLTATLRNVAEHPGSRTLFVSSILPELCVVLRQHCNDQDICMNISRIYSKLSCFPECGLALVQTPGCCQQFIELLNKHPQKQDLVVRLLFTLGNLASKSHEARELLFQREGCVDTLLRLYNRYQQRRIPHAPPQRGPQSASTSPSCPVIRQEDEDVLVKLVRVLANMCIHPGVGTALVTDAACVRLLMETLELRSVQESEELLVNVASTINNLAFYQEERSAIKRNRLAIAKLMLKLVLSSSVAAILVATRVYGNLSQSKDVRDYIMQNKVHRFVVTLLDSKSTEVCFAACGVLTNLALDPPNRVALSLEGAAAKLTDCLRDLGAEDWQLAGQACQALWNVIGSGSETRLEKQETERLLDVLNTYLDVEALKWTENEDERSGWESEFLPVAWKLVKILTSPHQTA